MRAKLLTKSIQTLQDERIPYQKCRTHPPSLLPPTTQIPSTQRLRPPLRLLLLPHLAQSILIQRSRIASLRSIDTLLARHIAHTAEYAATGESTTDTFCNTALDGVDVLIASEVGGEFIYGRGGVSGVV